MKRGVIYSTAKKMGYNKVAFGHHMDDAIDTLLMALIYEGRIYNFAPVTYLSRTDMTLIRPLIYTEESQIRALMAEMKIVPVKSGCPVDGTTKRAYVKALQQELKKENPNIKASLFGAIGRAEINGWKPMGFKPDIQD
jgi:tRNA 2-thiocytidine biosynthesis protein TtcA